MATTKSKTDRITELVIQANKDIDYTLKKKPDVPSIKLYNVDCGGYDCEEIVTLEIKDGKLILVFKDGKYKMVESFELKPV